MMRNYSEQYREQPAVMIRGFRSLTTADADLIRAEVRAVSVDWSIDCHDDYDGYLSLVITPATNDELTFLVSGKVDQIELAEMRDESMSLLGRFNTLDAAISGLTDALRAATPKDADCD